MRKNNTNKESRVRRGVPVRNKKKIKNPRSMFSRYIPLALILIGCVVVSVAIFMRAYSGFRQNQFIKEYESTEHVNTESVSKEDTLTVDVLMPDGDSVDEGSEIDQDGKTTEEIDKNIQLLGVLKIPKIDLSVAIGEGTDNATLKYTVGHFKDTPLPGAAGNACIAGHRNYTWGKFFNRLDEVELGDEIDVESGDVTYTYTVKEILVVNPEDTWVLDQSDESQITLITCTPMYSATHRLVVRGTLNS